ncbi:MAG: TrkA family potassium uptake protein [Clostridia bacterium]|nr:TrkA family potassium uptake protein [Clostridia bacterium]
MKIKKQNKNNQLYAVIGLGRFGFALAQELAAKGKDVLVIDKDRAKIDEAAEFTPNAFVIEDGLTAESLAETGIAEADVAIIGIGEQFDVSILTTMQVLRLGVKRVIAKARSREQGEVLSMLGAEVIYPEHDMALRLAGKLVSPHVLEYISLSDSIDIMELSLTAKVDGMTVIDLGIRPTFHLNIIAVRSAGEITTDIRPATVLHAEDTITVIGKNDDIRAFEEYLHS